ncbi:MAG: monofunctional biosynthetic peptidoglycan transglycosylase [Deltaproteobacteria bacterium]|nr:monofunctional biosynthetic peptidoglycan transglycosylase [Deltaproteobacteria bacterium]
MVALLIKPVKFFIILAAILVVFLSFFFISLPNVSYLKEHNPRRTRFMEIYLDREQKKQGLGQDDAVRIEYEWISYGRISPHLKKAVIVAEDSSFFGHEGFDWEAIKKAMRTNMRRMSFSRGGSTITQQLVKNLYLTPSKNPFRKIREWVVTYQMEQTLSKRRIFEIYLNVIEWGNGIYGAEAASEHYFSKSASKLNASEAAYLSAIIPNPKLYTQKRYAKRINQRKSRILARMNGKWK